MHSSVKRIISIYDVPEDEMRRIIEVLQNDLNEYESLDRDFGPGTENAIKKMIQVVEPYTTEAESHSDHAE